MLITSNGIFVGGGNIPNKKKMTPEEIERFKALCSLKIKLMFLNSFKNKGP